MKSYSVLILVVIVTFPYSYTNAHCVNYTAEDAIDDVSINLNENYYSSKHHFIDITKIGFWVDQKQRSFNLSLEILGIPDVAENREYIIHISGSEWELSKNEKIDTTTILMNAINFNLDFYISKDFAGRIGGPTTSKILGDFSLICSDHIITLGVDNIPEEYNLKLFENEDQNSLHISAETNYYDGMDHYQDLLIYEREHQPLSNDYHSKNENNQIFKFKYNQLIYLYMSMLILFIFYRTRQIKKEVYH